MGQWVAACAAGDVDPEDVIPFEHDGKDYAIYRSPGDSYYATDGHCTHEQTLLCDGLVIGSVIECPKHNGRFDYTSGRALGAPVLVDVRTYPVKVADGTVYIEIGLSAACRRMIRVSPCLGRSRLFGGDPAADEHRDQG